VALHPFPPAEDLLMPRMHGERQEMFTARRAFAIEAHVATLAKEAEYRLKRANGVPLPTIEIPAPCFCKKYPGGHYHAIEKFGEPVTRFIPGTWERRA
jgi:hypothetical protein